MEASFQNARMPYGESSIRPSVPVLHVITSGTMRNAFDRWVLCLGSILLFAFVGCKGNDVHVQLLEQELRFQEDHIWELKWQLEDTQKVAETYRNEIETLKKLQAEGTPAVKATEPSILKKSFLTPSTPEPPGEIEFDTKAPEIESSSESPPMGSIEIPEGESLRSVRVQPANRAASEDSIQEPEELPPPKKGVSFLDSPLDSIALKRLLLGNLPPVPEGITLRAVVEPLDRDNATVPRLGEIALLVIDPSLPEDENRLLRWDFPVRQNALRWKESSLGEGFHYDVTIPDDIKDGTYELWVRMVLPNQEKYLASIPFTLDRDAIAASTKADTLRFTSIPERHPSAEVASVIAREPQLLHEVEQSPTTREASNDPARIATSETTMTPPWATESNSNAEAREFKSKESNSETPMSHNSSWSPFR